MCGCWCGYRVEAMILTLVPLEPEVGSWVQVWVWVEVGREVWVWVLGMILTLFMPCNLKEAHGCGCEWRGWYSLW